MTTKEFESLPLNEQKVLIAKDILEQVKLGTYTARRMVYVQFNEHAVKDKIQVGDDMQSTLNLLEDCTVCAYGSLMLSAIRFKNSVNWDESGLHFGVISRMDFNYTRPLTDLFSESQLKLIENAFEGWENDEDDFSPKVFYDKFDNPTDRMIAIMENLIANDGEFVL